MTTIVTRMHSALRTRAAYRRTLRELRSLPVDVALDLDLHPGDAKAIARRAVYGR
jgi:uncharacterized protein YjiS (DUF1127 family)